MLAPTSWVNEQFDEGGNHVLSQRLTMAFFGAGVVVLIALIGRTVAGDRAGLIAAAIAALYPNLWMNDGLIMSETLATAGGGGGDPARVPLRPNAHVAERALGRRHHRDRDAAPAPSSVCCCRSWCCPSRCSQRALALGRRLVLVVVSCLAALVVVSPWLIANLTRFDEPVLFSSNDGLTICGANNDGTYYGSGTGLWAIQDCGGVQPRVAERARARGVDAVERPPREGPRLHHRPPRPPARGGGGTGRAGLEPLRARLHGELQPQRGARDLGVVARVRRRSGCWCRSPSPGRVILRRRKVPITPLVAQFVVVTVTAVAIYGLVRFRIPAEVSIVVLSAVAVDRLFGPRPEMETQRAVQSPDATAGGSPRPFVLTENHW